MIDTDMPGSFASVQAAATWLTTLASEMESAGDAATRARTAASGDWDGPSNDAYTAHISQVISAGDTRAALVRRCGTAVDIYAWELRACQQQMLAHRERAAAGGLTVTGTQIHEPLLPSSPGPPLLLASPEQRKQYTSDQVAFTDGLERINLFDELCADVRATYDRLDTCVQSTLQPAQEEAATRSGLAQLLDDAKVTAENSGRIFDFGDAGFTVREKDLRKAAEAAAVALAAQRSRNPAVRSGTRAPTARGLANAKKPGTGFAALASKADDAARWGRFLKFGGPVIGLVGSGIALAQGESPGRVVTGYVAGLAGAALAGAAVVGLVATAPAWVVGGAAVLGGVAVTAAANAVWDNLVPDDVKESIDNGVRDAWDWTTETAGDTWDNATDSVSDAWAGVFG